MSTHSALRELTTSNSTGYLLNAALDSFLTLLLRSARPDAVKFELEAPEMLVVVEKVTKEREVQNENYKFSAGVKQQFEGGIVEIVFVRFTNSPYSLISVEQNP